MAKKSKAQKAKASAARAQKKAEQEVKEKEELELAAKAAEAEEKPVKKKLFKKAEATPAPEPEKKPVKKEEKKPEKAKKRRFGFLSDVRAEMHRVTWPSRQDVLRWSLVVVGALVFFGVFTAVLDGIFPIVLRFISGLGA